MACNFNHNPCEDHDKKPWGCHKPEREDPCGCDAAAFSAPAECYTTSSAGCGISPDCARVLSACGDANDTDEPADCTGIPIHCPHKVKYRTCCDQNGRCYRFPCQCRNPFWPEFAHPRWLCCQALYCNGSCACGDAREQNEQPCGCAD